MNAENIDSGYERLPFRLEFPAFHLDKLVLVRKVIGTLRDWVLQSSSHFAVVRFCTELATFPYAIHQSLSSSNCVHLSSVRAWTRGSTFSDLAGTRLLTAYPMTAKKYALLCKRSGVLLAMYVKCLFIQILIYAKTNGCESEAFFSRQDS